MHRVRCTLNGFRHMGGYNNLGLADLTGLSSHDCYRSTADSIRVVLGLTRTLGDEHVALGVTMDEFSGVRGMGVVTGVARGTGVGDIVEGVCNVKHLHIHLSNVFS